MGPPDVEVSLFFSTSLSRWQGTKLYLPPPFFVSGFQKLYIFNR